MNRYEMRRMFGGKPRLDAVLIWSIQQALKGAGKRHPDSKRQRKNRQRNLLYRQMRELKNSPGHKDN